MPTYIQYAHSDRQVLFCALLVNESRAGRRRKNMRAYACIINARVVDRHPLLSAARWLGRLLILIVIISRTPILHIRKIIYSVSVSVNIIFPRQDIKRKKKTEVRHGHTHPVYICIKLRLLYSSVYLWSPVYTYLLQHYSRSTRQSPIHIIYYIFDPWPESTMSPQVLYLYPLKCSTVLTGVFDDVLNSLWRCTQKERIFEF